MRSADNQVLIQRQRDKPAPRIDDAMAQARAEAEIEENFRIQKADHIAHIVITEGDAIREAVAKQIREEISPEVREQDVHQQAENKVHEIVRFQMDPVK
jgi:hypothetical protein